MSRYIYVPLIVLIATLAYGCWHYRGSAADWQATSRHQQHRAETAESANDTLATANASLNARNTNLVESLNARSDELAAQQRRADANRNAYRKALAGHRDWATQRVPGAVARSLRAATRIQDSASTSGADSR
ncbi:hypothetical protein [Carnimonas bestiolae]|uniref:hypothetical protein n=1 Tax=Carnimonas bestiolae TaxID=3402172 RepID=UPI003F4AA9B7